MKVSIIVPVYNVEQYIDRCFESICTQTFDNEEIECLFIDDSSPDDSYSILKRRILKYSGKINYKIIRHKENKGLAGARNTGIEASTGEYIYFLDSDDEILPNCIKFLVKTASTNPDCDYIQGSALRINHLGEKFDNYVIRKDFPNYSDNKRWLTRNILGRRTIPVTAWNKLIKKDFIVSNSLSFKEGILHEDEHWNYKATLYIKKIAFCKNPTYLHYLNDGTIMTNSDKTKSLTSWGLIISDASCQTNKNISVFHRKFVYQISFNALKSYFFERHTLDDTFIKSLQRGIVKFQETIPQKGILQIVEQILRSIFFCPGKLQKLIVTTPLRVPYPLLLKLFR
ncbi:glycosyltransferase family 2 protein [Sunxiuqinia indica]|uniref:glycosyltransferase family 2 protein n=1 Tax=Sunxiuqinia indica TaxID=2692584 RepID=UPI00135B07F4|nr:glycosyltransferase family 2 protein [Sunxiuqinia indica]